jgi:ribosome-associated protein
MEQADADPQLGEERISKTRRKHDMLARQQVGEALVALSEAQLQALSLPERLFDAVVEAKRIGKFGALRRQLQYIGRLMREDADSIAIAAQLEALRGESRRACAEIHVLERWRDRLLESDDALTRLLAAHPGADAQRLRALVRNARRERSLGRAPASFRELFQALRSIIFPPSAP